MKTNKIDGFHIVHGFVVKVVRHGNDDIKYTINNFNFKTLNGVSGYLYNKIEDLFTRFFLLDISIAKLAKNDMSWLTGKKMVKLAKSDNPKIRKALAEYTAESHDLLIHDFNEEVREVIAKTPGNDKYHKVLSQDSSERVRIEASKKTSKETALFFLKDPSKIVRRTILNKYPEELAGYFVKDVSYEIRRDVIILNSRYWREMITDPHHEVRAEIACLYPESRDLLANDPNEYVRGVVKDITKRTS